MTHLLSIRDLTREAVFSLFRLAAELKAKQKAGDRTTPLVGRTLALVFEKPSLRTRVTFEVGMVQLGGGPSISRARRSGWECGNRSRTWRGTWGCGWI